MNLNFLDCSFSLVLDQMNNPELSGFLMSPTWHSTQPRSLYNLAQISWKFSWNSILVCESWQRGLWLLQASPSQQHVHSSLSGELGEPSCTVCLYWLVSPSPGWYLLPQVPSLPFPDVYYHKNPRVIITAKNSIASSNMASSTSLILGSLPCQPAHPPESNFHMVLPSLGMIVLNTPLATHFFFFTMCLTIP